MKKSIKILLSSLLMISSLNLLYAESGHQHGEEEHEEGGHEEGGEGLELSAAQIRLANIEVKPLVARHMDYQIYAPAELKTNGYTSYLVSPRVDSVVLKRHITLGESVKKGQTLVTLFSQIVAQGQADFQVIRSEWLRVKKLGRKTVGAKRFVAAKVGYEAALGRLVAFGLSKKRIQSSRSFGEYDLIATHEGLILADDFHQGQRVEAGTPLIELVDEHVLWAIARLTPQMQLEITKNTKVKIKSNKKWFNAKVSQQSHIIDPQTRTRIVRLEVDNSAHQLHPNLFVDAYFTFKTKTAILAVPESALMRGADGDWTVFIKENGQFIAKEVELGRTLGKWREISGIEPNHQVVMKGAFFVASQALKGGFDPHNH